MLLQSQKRGDRRQVGEPSGGFTWPPLLGFDSESQEAQAPWLPRPYRCRLPVWSSPLGSVGRWVKCTQDDREGSGKECATICKDLGPDPLLETLTLELGRTARESGGLFFTMSLPLVSSWQKGTEGGGRVMGFGKVWPRGGTSAALHWWALVAWARRGKVTPSPVSITARDRGLRGSATCVWRHSLP